ncbi:hypothetical protein BKA80DRAFT_23054 [Phyllosticta citrichinensis]
MRSSIPLFWLGAIDVHGLSLIRASSTDAPLLLSPLRTYSFYPLLPTYPLNRLRRCLRLRECIDGRLLLCAELALVCILPTHGPWCGALLPFKRTNLDRPTYLPWPFATFLRRRRRRPAAEMLSSTPITLPLMFYSSSRSFFSLVCAVSPLVSCAQAREMCVVLIVSTHGLYRCVGRW